MTSAQKRAADPAVSAWVAAAAGTGKTRVLRDRVLRLMLGGTAPERILCLTYTKAAAAEMANRVNDALAAWGRMEDDALKAALADIGVAAPSAAQLDRARRLFTLVLDAPGGMKIETIHAFCQSILGRFPIEADMAPHFRLMEDHTARELQREALDAVFAELGTVPQPALEEAVTHLAGHCADGTLKSLMTELFLNRTALASLWARAERTGGLDRLLADMLGFDHLPQAEALLAKAAADGAFDHPALTRVCRAKLDGAEKDKQRGQMIADWLSSPHPARIETFSAYSRVYLTTKGEIAKSLVTKSVTTVMPDALDILLAEATRIKSVCDRLNAARIWAITRALHRLGARVVTRYKALKNRLALMDYDDLIEGTRRLLMEPGIAPWVLYKLDGGIDHILVDEAQDTSPEQWQIIEALAREFFAGDGASETLRTVFAVGDVQQSIYGFQGAAPDLFTTYRDRFASLAAGAGKPFLAETLDLTYRTAQPVLDVVNAVFAQKNRTTRMDAPGLVELWPVETKIAALERDAWTPPVTQEERDDPAARTARRIADTVASWLASGEAVAPGDIMILVRRRNEFVGHMIRALKARNIAVAGADRMLLLGEIVVADLTAAAAFALLPEDDLTLAALLKSPLVGLDEDALFTLCHKRQGSLWEELRRRRGETQAFAAAHAALADLLANADRMPPFEFFSDILTRQDGRRKLIARLGVEAIDPLEEFLSLALDFEATHTPSLQEFLHWLESSDFIIQRSADGRRDEVRVMTVHGAKGLEAPIVFLPDTCGLPQRKSPLLWVGGKEGVMLWPQGKDMLSGAARDAYDERDREDMREYDRLLYVAMTRARDRLYIGGFEKRKRSEDCWYERVRRGLDALGVAADEDGIRRYGDTGSAMKITTAPVKEEAPVPLPSWLTAPPPAEPTPPRPLTPSRPEEEEPPVMSPGRGDGEARFRRGRVIHRLLELLPDLPSGARAEAGRRFLTQHRPALTAAEQEQWLKEVLAVIADPAHAAFFGPSSAAEVPIVGVVDGRPLSGQVDRLAVTEEAVHVIDYKTNRPAPMTQGTVPAAYRRQMAAYRRVLSGIYPDRPIHCALLWTDGPKLLWLHEEDDTASP